MELLACIVALEHLREPTRVALHSDSAYVVNGITRGWARSWQKRGWKRGDGQPAKNPDLWNRLLELCEIHDVQFIKVKGHVGIKWNERCDQLVGIRIRSNPSRIDAEYERQSQEGLPGKM